MTDRPILFSAPMVQAILREIRNPGTGKTQTRRVLKPQPPEASHFHSKLNAQSGQVAIFSHPLSNEQWKRSLTYSPGDRLWVREAWRAERSWDNRPPRDLFAADPIWTEADGEWSDIVSPSSGFTIGKLRPSMFMPRWASRITLDVTDVRVQRLQEIDEQDAKAEGVTEGSIRDEVSGVLEGWSAKTSFRTLWDSLNADRAPWADNPWVVAVTFRPHLCNIDQMEKAA